MLTVVLLLTEDELVSASTKLVSSDRAMLLSTWRTEDGTRVCTLSSPEGYRSVHSGTHTHLSQLAPQTRYPQ